MGLRQASAAAVSFDIGERNDTVEFVDRVVGGAGKLAVEPGDLLQVRVGEIRRFRMQGQ